jgi:hypothetical protein
MSGTAGRNGAGGPGPAGWARRLARRAGAAAGAVRGTPRSQLLLRVLLLLDGGAALALSAEAGTLPGRAVVFLGAVALVASLAAPAGLAPAGVVAAAVLGWVLRYGLHGQVPAAATVVLAVVLYLFHDLAALVAALPPTAPVGRDVLGRWYAVSLAVAVVTVPVGVAVLVADGVEGGRAVDLLGMLGVVALAGVPVLLARRGDR